MFARSRVRPKMFPWFVEKVLRDKLPSLRRAMRLKYVRTREDGVLEFAGGIKRQLYVFRTWVLL